MAFTEIEIHKIRKLVGELCKKRSPEHIREKLRCEYKIQNQDVIIFEVRRIIRLRKLGHLLPNLNSLGARITGGVFGKEPI